MTVDKLQHWVYDIEVFPNFFSAVFIETSNPWSIIQEYIDADIDNDVERKRAILLRVVHKVFVISDSRNDFPKLKRFIKESVDSMYIGYNNKEYDDIIIDYMYTTNLVFQDRDTILKSIYSLSKNIIHYDGYNFRKDNKIRYSRTYLSVDLYTLLYLNSSRVSLKQVQIALKWYKVEEYEMPPMTFEEVEMFYDDDWEYAESLGPFDRHVLPEYEEAILDYDFNDTLSTLKLFIYSKSELRQRVKAIAKYGIGTMSDSRSTLADKLLSKAYSKRTGYRYWEYFRNRTYRALVPFSHIINPAVEFRTPELKAFLRKLKDYVVDTEEDSFEETVEFRGKYYTFAKGGLHSVDKPQEFKPTDRYRIVDGDVTSYYPFGIINMKVVSDHISPSFIDVYLEFVLERVEAKKDGRKDEADILKIVVNAPYGKLGSPKSWLYDLMAMYKVTINLQLFLLMWVEDLELNGFEVISANTDGLVSKVPRDRYDEYIAVSKAWADKLDFELEYTEYDLYVRTTVNDYLCIVTNGKYLKLKGDFVSEKGVEKGYYAPIIAKTLQEYYKNGVNIKDYLRSRNKPEDIYDFCISIKVGRQFETVSYYIEDGKPKEIVRQRSNRYYVSNGNQILRKKKKETGKYTNILKGQNTTVFNKFYRVENFDDYNINYSWYEARVLEMINRINREVHKKKTKVEVTGRLFDNIE